MTTQQTESWGSRVGLVLAMAGNAVGLGNFLRFPVQAVQNGGGSFIIPYLICFVLMGLPLLFVEWSVGRLGGKYGHHSTPFILDVMSKRRFWKYIGVFGIFTNLAVAAYYCYLESWTLAWVWYSVSGAFQGQSQEGMEAFFGSYTALDSYAPVAFWIFCLLLNTYILSKGLSGGVEKAAKIGVPMLLVFGLLLAIMAITITEGENGAIANGTEGLNFLWEPDFSSIWKPSVWLAAAGQMFFTLSLGMGTIQCYASYIKPKQDIALNAMGAGWTNEFVEVVLGSSILIPIGVGYLGVEKIIEVTAEGGFGLGFITLPYLFDQWGAFLSVAAGIMWFGLLFFAGITSSLAMGTPCMGFLVDEFGWRRERAAWAFGFAVFILGLPTVLFFQYGVFDEYDYWAGTVSLVFFATFEIFLFAWVFGMEKGWKEITEGADIHVPIIFKYVIKYVTPVILLFVFVSSLPDIGRRVTNRDIHEKVFAQVEGEYHDPVRMATLSNGQIQERMIEMGAEKEVEAMNTKILYLNGSRLLLLLLFVTIALMIYVAYRKRRKEQRITTYV